LSNDAFGYFVRLKIICLNFFNQNISLFAIAMAAESRSGNIIDEKPLKL
jgi:hypothetical protein